MNLILKPHTKIGMSIFADGLDPETDRHKELKKYNKFIQTKEKADETAENSLQINSRKSRRDRSRATEGEQH